MNRYRRVHELARLERHLMEYGNDPGHGQGGDCELCHQALKGNHHHGQKVSRESAGAGINPKEDAHESN